MRLLYSTIVVAPIVYVLAVAPAAAQEADGPLVDLIVGLLHENDKDLRALGLEQVRTEAKGEGATKRFADELPKLPSEAQAGLLRALADRGDTSARHAVLQVLKTSREEPVRLAAVSALGSLGETADLKTLVQLLAAGSPAEKTAARTSLTRLRGDAVLAAIAAEIEHAPPPTAVALIEILMTRRALDTIPQLLTASMGSDSTVRTAAMAALGQMAPTEHIGGMVQGVLKAQQGRERDAAERAIAAVCGRIADAGKRAEPLLNAMEKRNEAERIALLPALGRVGGPQALARVEREIADAALAHHAGGIRALCNWPDASVAPRLIKLAKADEHDEHRALALAALIRVAPLPDGRSDSQKLELVKTVMPMCASDEQRNLLLTRASAIRTIETLRYVLPYLDQPAHAQQACQSIVELAHHRGLREPNKAEFHQALDNVIAISKDAVVIDRAKRYKADQTWVRPAATKSK
jgi:HEAT repeat protein